MKKPGPQIGDPVSPSAVALVNFLVLVAVFPLRPGLHALWSNTTRSALAGVWLPETPDEAALLARDEG